MNSLLADLRYALRMLLKSPGFTATAVIALAVGIGANTAVFSVTNAILLRSLPYQRPGELVWISKVEPQFGIGGLTAGAYLDFREQSETFAGLAAYSEEEFTLSGTDDPQRVVCGEVSAALFPLLGVEPLLGRTFLPEEEQVGRDDAVVVSEAFWRSRGGSDPAFIGRTLTLNDKSYTVVGVMPGKFRFPRALEIWKPLALDPEQERHGKSHRLIQLIGRLKSNVAAGTARAELNTIWNRSESEADTNKKDARIQLVPLHEHLIKDVRLAILVLLGAVAVVLLIACANVANLMLARAAERRKEIAIRAALGAARGRIIRQLLTESVLLSLLGGALGFLLAIWGVDLLVASIPPDVIGGMYGLSDVGVDRGVLAFTIAVSVFTGILFGFAPAMASSKLDLNEALKATAKTATTRSGSRGVFVVSQLALTVVLLIGAGLMTRSFVRLLNVQLGFNPQKVLTLRVELPESRYGKGEQRRLFFTRLLERVETLPGVQSSGAISQLPLSGYSMMGRFQVEGQPLQEPGKGPTTPIGAVNPGYFPTMQIPLVQGRFFNASDANGASEVALVNESFAKRYWPGESPLGKRVGALCSPGELCRTVIGVVGDIRHEALTAEPHPEVYLPYTQLPTHSLSLLLRTNGDPLALVSGVREQVRALDKDQPIALVQTLSEHVSESVLQPRLLTTLLGTFAGLALILAAVGVYGMMSYSVAQRRSEIGIRMALGAAKASIFRLVVGHAMALIGASLAIGIAAAFAVTRLLSSLLYNVGATDPLTFAAMILLVSIVGFVAAWLPAHRATLVDPMTALRTE